MPRCHEHFRQGVRKNYLFYFFGFKGRASARKVGAVCSPELAEGLTAKSNAVAGLRRAQSNRSHFHKHLFYALAQVD